MAAAEELPAGDGSPAEGGDPASDLFDLIDSNIEVYNQNLNLAPGFLKSLVGDEEILFVITLEDGGELYAWGVTESAEFIEFEKLESPDGNEPTITVRSDEATVRSIIDSSSPVQKFSDALKSGKVVVEDAGFLQSLMLWAMKVGLGNLFM
ncbi:hypothetical protein FTO70_07900 [Methanosarcina sp. KYL-1]|uniref:hypothetical protein n=1 Tax=Methanosarcina sp. KYL-1 TaxID=2602068 RepID=UPI002100700F|nr:hypothetical protein [Methanosarcina sp. KYL-1]MCQ1535600.1 hypothetical protein [Methanosarcina sp. KYL-1]